MQTQGSPTEGPQSPNGAANGVPRSSGDLLVDKALSAFESGLGDGTNEIARDPTAPRKGKRPAREPAAEPEAPDAEEADEDEEEDLAGTAEEDEGEDGAEDASEDEEPHDTRGSKEDPFSVKELPSDKYIQLKVDGEKVTVSLRELADGYIGQRTISARLNKTKALTDEATQHIERAKHEREQVRGAVRELLGDAGQLYEYFLATGDREKVLEEVALRYAEQLKKFRLNPHERLAFERRRDEMRLQQEREHWQAQQRAEAEDKQRKELHQRFTAMFTPGWEQGLKKAGFPKPTQQLYEEVMVRANQRAQSGQLVTSDDIAEFTYRACKLLELPPKGATKPRPAPASAPKERGPARRRSNDPWAGKSSSEKRKDLDWWTRNLKRSDYR